MEGGAARRNWAAPVAPLAGEGVGKDEELTGARLVLTDGVGMLSAAACGGGRRCLSLELLLRWREGADSASIGTGRWCGSCEVARALGRWW
jgi:hypothetical protein